MKKPKRRKSVEKKNERSEYAGMPMMKGRKMGKEGGRMDMAGDKKVARQMENVRRKMMGR